MIVARMSLVPVCLSNESVNDESMCVYSEKDDEVLHVLLYSSSERQCVQTFLLLVSHLIVSNHGSKDGKN